MDKEQLIQLFNKVKEGSIDPEQAAQEIKDLPFKDLGFAKVDIHRSLRRGVPEVIFCQGKTPEHIIEIIKQMDVSGINILGTKCSAAVFNHICHCIPELQYNELAQAFFKINHDLKTGKGTVLVMTAGTSDIPVAEEAAITVEVMGSVVKRVWDVGIAGIHRLFDQWDELQSARVIIVVAGMEGALPSVVSGLVKAPVIAVPSSIGYGASFGGVAALLAMLNSCAGGVAVVNIDNGFGAGYLASIINALD